MNASLTGRDCCAACALVLGLAACSPTPPVSPGLAVWVVSETGAGPIRAGMTLLQAAAVLGAPPPDTTKLERACDYVELRGAPPGVGFIAVEGYVARVDVDTSAVATDRGARVGDTEERVRSLYAGRVQVEPHKYDDRGHYLVVRPVATADSGHRLIFETDGVRVKRYRVGLLPAVAWVEGCS